MKELFRRGAEGLWPSVVTLEGAKAAADLGYWAAVFVAGATGFVVLLGQLGIHLFGPEHFGIAAITDVLIFAGIAWGIARYSRVGAVLGLTLYIVERVGAWYDFGTSGVGMTILLSLFFINGIRGTFAYHRMKVKGSPI